MSDTARRPRICVAGAGSIGCFVGGLLVQAGHDVRFLARSRIIEAVARDGLTLTDYSGLDLHLTALAMTDDPAEALAEADLVLVAVKSGATAQIATDIQAFAPHAQVISLQNGVANADALRRALPQADVRASVVPFNVVAKSGAAFHRASSGDILVEAGPLPSLGNPHLIWTPHRDIAAVQWGKLLINLGNAINALADMPLLDQLHERRWRRLIADQMAEALHVLRAAGITPAKTTAAPPHLIPHILRLPTPLFRVIAAQMLTIDAQARSSMWEDLSRGRPTEIDALQGEILSLAERNGRQAPLNTRMHALIKAAEAAGKGPPGLGVDDIRQ
ncbi:2-dehydropantoate 2-reductase [uncultured Tateyamaria sp.]|uniref:2-dehydropantoate 2-reductase n=1 Tax=uncultured Tateyamaria sp. TaxID=455651 RepID=UPI002627CFD6|nr:2-dehydropantoate 2-reductase [uncultured Tateyamaria sp.]